MVCGQIRAPATLPNYVHMHLMNKALRRQAAILETWYVYFVMLCNRGIFHKIMFWTDPKMTFYGRTMVKIKMIVTG